MGIDAKVARLNKHYKKSAKGQKKDVQLSLVQEFSSPKEKRALKIKQLDAKVAKLNKDFMSKKKSVKAQVNVQPKKQVKVQKKKKKHSVETTLLQDFSSQKEKRALKVKEVDEKVAKLNKDFMSKKKSAKAQPKKQVKAQPKKQVKVQKKKKKHSVETTLLQDFSS